MYIEIPSYEEGVHKWAGMVWRYVRAIRPMHPDVILSFCAPANILGALAWRFTGAKAFLWNQRDEGQDLGTRVAWYAARFAPTYVSNSGIGAEFLVQNLGVSRESVRVVHNGVMQEVCERNRDTWRAGLGLGDDCYIACMVAHIHRRKDHQTLIKAWRLVIDELTPSGRDAVLLLAGRPGGAAAAKALAFDLDLGRRVRFLGDVKDIRGLLSASDIGVFSSKLEGCPNGVLECMACGLPVVATDIPGVREAVGPEGYGLLAAPENHEQMACLILDLARSPERACQIGAANRRRIDAEFTVSQMGRRMADVIAGTIPRCSGGHHRSRPPGTIDRENPSSSRGQACC